MDYLAMEQQLLRWKEEDPLLSVAVFGRSLLGRNLYCVTLGQGQPRILLVGGVHGMEHITSALLLWYGAYLGKKAVPCQVTIVPMLNPDGVEIHHYGSKKGGQYRSLIEKVSGGDPHRWQANGRGVDLNHNFNANWYDLHRREQEAGIVGPGWTRFGGTFPESEPETAALVQLCRKGDFAMAVAFHTQGEEIYWDYHQLSPPEGRILGEKMAAQSGYRLSSPEGLAEGGGFKDWFLTSFHRPAFTVEMGKGENPLPEGDFPALCETMKALLDGILFPE
jgi:g-D-glutamyl-meso-diaminopimelate peptidase